MASTTNGPGWKFRGTPAPAGLEQQREAERQAGPAPSGGPGWSMDDYSGAGPIGGQRFAPKWATGGQVGSIENGYDTPFYEEFFRQQEEEAEKKNLGNLYKRTDFTGVVTYNGMTDAKGREARFGDIYERGEKVGNAYEMFDRAQADVMLLGLTHDRKEQATIYRQLSSGDDEAVARAVQSRMEEATAEQAKFLTQADYEGRVSEQKRRMEDGGPFGNATDEILTGVAGALGGALATWWAGPFAALGAAVGAGAALLNQDEILDQAARAKVQQDMAGEQFGTMAGVSTGLMGWSGMAGKFLSPLSNLSHGIYDASTGTIGDGQSAWYDQGGIRDRAVWMTGLDVVTGLGDAAMQFGSGVGQVAYMTQMAGHVLGRGSQLATADLHAFSDTRGTFDDISRDDEGNFDLGSLSAGIASVGIDAVQMGGRGGLLRMFRQNDAALAAGLGGQTVQAGGRSFRLDADGTAQWARGTKGRSMNLSMLAPSESLTAISARVQAQRIAAARGSRVVTADDYYRAATRISSGNATWGNALVQGMGEGYEEAVQAVLDPLSHHDRIDVEQIFDAGLQGFGMGVGMRLGPSLQARTGGRPRTSADDRAYAQAVLARADVTGADMENLSPEQVLPRAEWNKMSASQKSMASRLSPQQRALYKEAYTKLAESQAATQAVGIAGVEKVKDAVRVQAASESGRAASLTDGAYVITQAEDADISTDSVTSSLTQTIKLIDYNVRGLVEQQTFLERAGGEDAAATVALNAQVIAESQNLLAVLGDLERQAESARATGDNATVRAAVQRANQILRAMFDDGVFGEDANPELVNARQRAATMLFVRNPVDQSGSFPALVPQASYELTRTGSHNVLQVPHAILQAIGGDFDGDKIVHQTRLILDDTAFTDLRAGTTLVGAMSAKRTADTGEAAGTAPTVNIGRYDYENHEIDLVAGALAGTNTAAATTANEAIGAFLEALSDRYTGVIPDAVLTSILDRTRERLRLGEHAARDLLLTELIDEAGTELWAMARERRSNELLWVTGRFQKMLQGFQRWNAQHVATKNPEVNTDIVTPVVRNSRQWSYLQQRAATEGQTLALEAEGWSLFRMFQKLHYSVFNAQVVGNNEAALVGAMRDLTQAYEALSQGVTQNALEATGARDVIAQKVIARLQAITAQSDAPSRSIPLVAQMAVADLRVVDGQPVAGDKPITLLQLLLRQAVNEDRHDNAAVVTPELEAKWARLDQLTRPGASGEAFVEMLGSMTLWELLGTAASSMGPQLTVEQFTRLYIAQGPETRRVTSQRLRMEPAYGSREGKRDLPFAWEDIAASEVTAFRSVIESILEAGNKRITLKDDGTAGGRLGERSAQYQRALVESFEHIGRAITALGMEPTVPNIQALFEMDPGFARTVFDLIPDADVNGVFDLVNGDLRVSPWVYEMLTMPPSEAAMHYLRNITLAQWTAKGARIGEEDGDKARTYRSLNNRLHQVMFRLANAGDGGLALDDFMAELHRAKDVLAFEAYVNTKVRLSSEPPFAMWMNDPADFSPDKANGGWSSMVAGAEQREAILALRERSERLVTEIADEARAAESDNTLMAALLAAQKAGTDAAPADRVLLSRLQEALDFSKARLTAQGPNSMLEQILGAQRTFYGRAHTKGVAPDNVLAAGAFQAMGDVPGFATQYERLRDTLISVDAEDLGASPQTLAHDDVDTMSATGATVEWKALDVPTLLDMWSREPRARKLIRAMLFPSVYERTPSGRLTQQFLTGQSMKELLDRSVYQSFFADGAESKLTYLSLLESEAKREGGLFAAQRAINDILFAHTTSAGREMTTRDHEERVQSMALSMAQIGRMVGSVYSNLGEAGLARVRAELTGRLQDRQGSAVLGHRERDREYVKLYFEGALEAREVELLEQQAQLVEAGDQAAADRIGEYIKQIRRRVDSVLDSTAFQRFRDSHRIDWDDSASIDQRKMDLREYVVRHQGTLRTKTPWAAEAIQRVVSPLRTVNGVPVLHMNEAADQDAWDVVVDAVTAAYMQDATTVQAEGIAVPELQWGKPHIQRYWDPTFSYLLDFLDPAGPFAKAAKTLHERTYGTQHPTHGVDELTNMVSATVLADEYLADWSVDIARVSLEANQRLDSSAAGDAVAMAGIAPRRQFTVATATERTERTDMLDHTVSVGRVPLLTLVAGRGEFATDLTTAQRQGEAIASSTLPNVPTPLALLNGRYARGARLVVDGEAIDLWNGRPPLGHPDVRRPAVAQSGFRAITVRQLQRAVEAALPAGVDASKVTVEIDYLHPDSQPAEAGYYNSIFYEGVVFEHTAADTQNSLISALWFSPGGLSPSGQVEALGANKKGKLAYVLGRPFSSRARKAAEASFLTDFSGMLTAKADAVMAKDLGNGRLDPTLYNAVLKDVKLRHFVRGTQAGRPVLWSAEQVIAWQRANPGQPLTDVLEGAELWKPSARVLRTMLGEAGDQGAMGALQTAFDPDPASVERYQGVTDAMLARVPDWTGRTDLFSTTAADRTFFSRFRMRPVVDAATRAKLDQGLMYRNSIRTQIHAARARNWPEGHAAARATSAREAAEAALRSETPGFDLAAAGFPFITAISGTDKVISQAVLHGYAEAVTLTGRETGWIYQEYVGDKMPDLAAGILTQTSVDPSEQHYAAPAIENQMAPGDLVVVQLDTIEAAATGLEAQIKLARRRLSAMAGQSPVIALTNADGARELRVAAGQHLESLGYERVAGSRHLYAPAKRGSKYQTRQARISTLTETHTESAENLMTVFLANQDSPLPITENAALLVSRNPQRTIAMPVSLVPVNAYGSFGLPQGREMVDAVKAQVAALREPRRFAHLLKLSGIEDATSQQATDLAAALDRYLEVADDRGLPGVGAEFGTGDIVPLVDRKGRLLLYRHGMKPPREIDSQLADQMVDGKGGQGVAIYGTEPLPEATTYTGTVVRFERNSQYGLSVQLRVPLQHLGNKIQLEANGMKYVLTSAGERAYLPEHELFNNGIGIDLISDLSAALSKESTGGMVNNFRNAFAYFGVDFVPELLQFFTGVDYSTLSARDQALAHGTVTTILREIHKRAGELSPSVVQELMQAPYLDKQINDVVRSMSLPGVVDTFADSVLTITDNDPVETRIGRAAVLYMLMPQAQPFHILRAGGVNSGADVRADGSQTVFMPRIFTEVFDALAPGDPVRKHLMAKLNSQISNPADGSQWYHLGPDFTFSMRNADGETLYGTLQFAQGNSSGDNPVLNEQAFARGGRQNWSRHSMDIAYEAINARTAAERGLEKTARFAQLRSAVSQGSLWEVLTDTHVDESAPLFMRERPGEVARRQLAYEAVGAFREALDVTDWTAEQKQQYEVARQQLAGKYGLPADQAGVVDFWVRQMLGMPLGEGDQGRIGHAWAMETLRELEWNADRHLLPTAGAEVPQLHVYDLALLFNANQGASARWWLVEGPDSTTRVESWEGWVQTALGTGQIEHAVFDPMYLLATDGFMHSYQDALESLVGLPVSRDMLVAAKMIDPETDRLLQSLDPHTDRLGKDPMLLETELATFADLMGAERIAGTFRGKQAPTSVLSKRRAARLKWRKENGVPMPMDVTMKNYRDKGVHFIDESTNSHAIMRILTNLRAGNALLNPLLWISAGPEMWHRSILDDATNVIMGQGTGRLGQAATAVASGLGAPVRYTPKQLAQLRSLYTEMGQRSDFKGMLYKELVFKQPRLANAGRLERWSHAYAQFAAGWQDPTYGTPGRTMARRYVEKILEELASTDAAFTPEQVISSLHQDPTWAQKNMPDAHQAAANTIANVRSLRPTPMSLALRGIYEPMASSPHMPVNVLGHLVRMPLMFSGYLFNVATTITGTQGLSNLTAMLLHGRDTPGSLARRIHAAVTGKELSEEELNKIDMSTALDGINLSKMFVQGGLTHTGLFALGLAAGGLGLSGEDEEERRRRRAAMTTGGQFLYDPRRIQNDFRSHEAIFLDWLPPAFSSWFKTEGEDGRAMAELPWIMKQFISPLIGMERFFDTGDPMQIVWGFQDAVGSMPLFNASTFDSATQMFAELMANADDAAKSGAPQDLAKSYGFMVAALGTMERMLLENSFINMIYVGQDRYDRDQWKKPLTDSDGDPQVDLMGNPRSTTAMSSFIDPETGEVEQGYVNRSWIDATMHQLTESRLTLALLMSLTTGQGLSGSHLRNNMVVKQRVLEKPLLTQEEAEGLILSIMDEESYGKSTELLTEDGARAVFRGLYKGTVAFGSPALEGVYVPLEMRQAISEKWMADLVAEGLESGLTQKQAEQWMWDVWLGQGDSPYGVGINDILWAKEPGTIPYTTKIRYNQLNTTYTMGPDGQPYATGVTRDGIQNLFGLAPKRYYLSQDTNLGVDGRLNSIDEVMRLNTGMRALERTDETWLVPTDAEIGKSIEDAVRNLGKELGSIMEDSGGRGWVNYPRRSGWARGGGRGGGGFGGGGIFFQDYGGMALRLNAQRRVRMPHADDLYSINTSNPIIRRATIRRERFASERGRLNQWQ